jgi:hypothetical protein
MRVRHPWLLLAVGVLCATSATANERKSFEGYAEWRRGDALIIDGRYVLAASDCRFKGKGEARDFYSIPLGFEVKVEAERLPDGRWLAHTVEAKPNGIAMFEQEARSDFDAMEDDFLHHGWVFDVDRHGHRVYYGGLITDGPDVRYVRHVVQRLLPPYVPPSAVRVYVVDNPEENALAAPNGAVFVNAGLIDDVDENELALILGRELAHMTYEHARRRAKKGMWAHLMAAAGLAIADNMKTDVGRDVARALSIVGGIAVRARYDEKLEEQAERVGERYALEAGYDLRGCGMVLQANLNE